MLTLFSNSSGGSGRGSGGRRGSALLAVLWLAAALSAIAFSVANTVRGETERVSTTVDGLRTHYLAAGGVDRAICYMIWGNSHRLPDGSPRYWDQGIPLLRMRFPTGDAIVEVIPATARLNVNAATQEQLFRLLLALGAEPGRAEVIAQGIVEWRKPGERGGFHAFGQRNLTGPPTFPPRHASFEEIEEVLLVRGMTPELFYGSYVRNGEGYLVRRGGLRDCLSVYGSQTLFDANFVEPALLVAFGAHPEAARQIVQARRRRPFQKGQLGMVKDLAGPAGGKLTLGGVSIFTLRSTARLRLPNGQLSDLRRSVAATVKFFGTGMNPPYHTLRWYDQAPADNVLWP